MSDPRYSKVVFLAGFEGADGATTYSEEKNSRAATFIGNAQIDTAQSAFGSGSSMRFDGSGDAITFADNADWQLTTNTGFTIECMVRFASLPSSGTQSSFINHYAATGSQRAWSFGYFGGSSGGLYAAWSSDGSGPGSYIWPLTLTTGRWYHVAWSGGPSSFFSGQHYFMVHLDGVLVGLMPVGSSGFTTFNSTAALRLGAQDAGNYLNGWLDEVRITKGARRYNERDFSPHIGLFGRAARTGVAGGARQPVVTQAGSGR
jgi:hypothetical protein